MGSSALEGGGYQDLSSKAVAVPEFLIWGGRYFGAAICLAERIGSSICVTFYRYLRENQLPTSRVWKGSCLSLNLTTSRLWDRFKNGEVKQTRGGGQSKACFQASYHCGWTELTLLGKPHLQRYPTQEGTELGYWYSSCHQGCSCRARFNSILPLQADQTFKAFKKGYNQRDAGTGSGKAAGTHPSGKDYRHDIDNVSCREGEHPELRGFLEVRLSVLN